MDWTALNEKFPAKPLSSSERFIWNLFGWPDTPFQFVSTDTLDEGVRSQLDEFARTVGYNEALREDLRLHAERIKESEKNKRKWHLIFMYSLFLLTLPLYESFLRFQPSSAAPSAAPRYDQSSYILLLVLLLLVSIIASIALAFKLSREFPIRRTRFGFGVYFYFCFIVVYLYILLLLVSWVFLVPTIVTFFGMDQRLISLRAELTFLLSFGIAFVFLGLGAIPIMILRRFARYISYRNHVDTLCVARAVDILIDLSRNELLTHSDNRTQLIHRLNQLARMTNLLASHFGGDDKSTQAWTQEHFRHIASYVRERAQWVAAPRETTLNTLREDFDWLSTVYISRSYGEFRYAPDKKTKDKPQKKEQGWMNGLRLGTKFVVGIALPIALILFIQNLLPNQLVLGLFEPRIATLLLVAWILLFVDANLGLGVVAGLAGLAKGVREIK